MRGGGEEGGLVHLVAPCSPHPGGSGQVELAGELMDPGEQGEDPGGGGGAAKGGVNRGTGNQTIKSGDSEVINISPLKFFKVLAY